MVGGMMEGIMEQERYVSVSASSRRKLELTSVFPFVFDSKPNQMAAPSSNFRRRSNSSHTQSVPSNSSHQKEHLWGISAFVSSFFSASRRD